MFAVTVWLMCIISASKGYHNGDFSRGNCHSFNYSTYNYSLSTVHEQDEVRRDSYFPGDSHVAQIFTQLSGLNELHYNLHGANQKCVEAIEIYQENLRNGELAALKMYDANAKLPTGILKGNLNQFGDFDECLELEDAKYCLLELDLKQLWLQINDSVLENLVHSDYAHRGTITDPAHRVPNFSLIKWAVCLPRHCDVSGVKLPGIATHLRPELCQRKQDNRKWSFAELFAASVFGALAVIVMTSTLAPEATASETKYYQIFKSFSLKRTVPELFLPQESTLKSVHGIRALSALALFMCHKAVTQLFGPYNNASLLSEHMSQPWRIIGRTAVVYTDSFILLSGFLSAQSLIRALERNNSLGIMRRIVQRVFRILPNFLAIILFCTYILPNLGSGPMWPVLVNQHSNLCKKYMWRNLLFVHNYFGFENMCLTHSHQLGIDMQLFVLSPFIVWVIYRWRKFGYTVTAVLATSSCLLRAIAIRKWSLSYVVYFGIPISRMFDTANYSYILPTHRATVYLIGVCLAFFLKDGHFATLGKHKHATIFYFLASVGSGLYAAAGPYRMTLKSYVYDVDEAIEFGVLSPIFWSVAVCWTLHAAQYNYGGWFVRLLEWNGFQFFSKISYSFYLVQFPVFFYNVAKRRYSTEYDPFTLIETSESVMVLILSILLTLLVELPFKHIHATITTRRKYVPSLTKKSSID